MTKTKQPPPIPSNPPTQSSFGDSKGIYIPLDFLAREDLSLPEKILYAIIKRELTSKGRTNTTTLTDLKLSTMTGIGKRTVQRQLQDLNRKKLIGIVSVNMATNRDSNNIPNEIRGTRWIYLDHKLAGYRLRTIRKNKKPVEFLYALLVLERGMSPKQYVELMKRESKKARLIEQSQQDEGEDACYLRAIRESLADIPDDQLTEMEIAAGEAPGTYIEMKKQYLREQASLVSENGDEDGEDGLFDDYEPAKSDPD